jgi:prepilin-type N-terminal cleavage/methylation domain-containing protein
MAPIRRSRTGESREAGFTLTELLVVLAIIGLLIVAAPALLKTAMPGTQSLAATRALADELRMARGLAISRGTTLAVHFDDLHQSYRDADGAQHALPNHVGFAFPAAAAPRDAIFRSDGSSNGFAIFVGAPPARHRVTADWLTGRIAIDE